MPTRDGDCAVSISLENSAAFRNRSHAFETKKKANNKLEKWNPKGVLYHSRQYREENIKLTRLGPLDVASTNQTHVV